MKKSILLTIIIASIVVVAGVSVGFSLALTPTADSELVIVNATATEQTDTVTVTLECEGDQTQAQTGNTFRHKRQFAYMNQVQFRNGTEGEVLYQEQYRNQYRNRVQAGNTFMYQYHVEGLESGMQLTLRIQYNNGKVLTHTFTV
ncbi:MAG: hypothetical protein ACTSSK_07930 [Candidatus Heimdallarchaeota archaeon]